MNKKIVSFVAASAVVLIATKAPCKQDRQSMRDAIGDQNPGWSFGYTVNFDQNMYGPSNRVYITVVAPGANNNPYRIVTIGDGPNGTLTISSGKTQLKGYALTETGVNTGIFTGIIQLSPLIATQGRGPNGGILKVASGDSLTATLTDPSGQSVAGTAGIQYSIGEVRWLQSSALNSPVAKSYRTGQGIVEVIDPDKVQNPDQVEQFVILVWSSFDGPSKGIWIPVIETGAGTGIFRGTVNFSTSLASNGNTLHVLADGDAVTAQYIDTTLPAPYTANDKLILKATVAIRNVVSR